MSDFVFGIADATPPTTPVDETDGVYEQNLEHAEQAVGHLIEFFRRGPRNQLLVAAVMEQVQELEDQLWALANAFDLDDAVGDQLDILGRLNGEPRGNRTDDEYRAAIRVRILVNRSDGQVEQLIDILDAIDPTCTVHVAEGYPASLSISVDNISTGTFADVNRMMQQAKPAGVRLHFSVGEVAVGAVSPTLPLGGEIGAVDGTPAGFVIAPGS